MKIRYWTFKDFINNNKKGKVFDTMDTQVRSTSKKAYKELVTTGKRYTQEKKVLHCIMDNQNIAHPEHIGMSLREITTALGLEINSVAARVNELKKKGVVVEAPKRMCSISRKLIIPVKMSNAD